MAAPSAIHGAVNSNPDQLARKAIKAPRFLETLVAGLQADEARVKYGCAKALRFVSEQRPDLLYGQFDFFARLLDHENKIFQWEAGFVLSQLARVDAAERFDALFERYFAPITGSAMITAANVIRGAARIARAKPQLAGRVAAEVLKVERANYQTPECRNVAIGHAIVALEEIYDLPVDPEPVRRFVRRQLDNPRPATRKKAEQFLKRISRLSKATKPKAFRKSGRAPGLLCPEGTT